MTTKQTFADKVIDFNRKLKFSGILPAGFALINPFADNSEATAAMEKFYRKYYNDTHKRKFIIGINPSRHGAGVTGVPFTDTKRLASVLGIIMQQAPTHEVSSVFIYDVIDAFGGAEVFYKKFYINSPFPLAIVRKGKNNRWLNANYYDDKLLLESVTDFMIDSLRKNIALGLYTDEVFVLGKKNAAFLNRLNLEHNFFGRLIVLEHPRYIQQYKAAHRKSYIDEYLTSLAG
ncbi:MAG TPA: SMUG2 DNA glycosylase family protein [Smithellaceae bacterium]|jgi:hypothetical protein|nr:SMUG2 DNA glycosylase family protein [Syntrophaceae bacterium]HPL97008.1 SMUG2 DNA glycosylase family protein [Smithellaceae bacterium]HPV49409.1 SMUG2 DNA glycosylase family protein [Smithellaceae bacterium]